MPECPQAAPHSGISVCHSAHETVQQFSWRSQIMEWVGLRRTLKLISFQPPAKGRELPLHQAAPTCPSAKNVKLFHDSEPKEVVTPELPFHWDIYAGLYKCALAKGGWEGRVGKSLTEEQNRNQSHCCTFSLSASIFSFIQVTTRISTNGWPEETNLTSCCNSTEQRLIPRTIPFLFRVVLKSPDTFAIHKHPKQPWFL